MFNPHPRVESLAIDGNNQCLLIDNALLEPERWVERASLHREAFEALPGNAYPGLELHLPAGVTAMLDALLSQTGIRTKLRAGPTLNAYSRLAMVTRAPETLEPRQWICHRDRLTRSPQECALASVLYLFENAELGGTSFYRPRFDESTIAELVHDSGVLDAASFRKRHAIEPGYLTASNPYFEKTLTIPSQFNRLIFYSGEIFHSSHIGAAEKLSADPTKGRLTMNGFFVCVRG